MCLISLAIHNSKSDELNWGPLRDTIWSGNTYNANKLCSTSRVFLVVDDFMGITSNHFKCASTTTMNIELPNGPVKSMCSCFQGRSGHDHGCSKAVEGLVSTLDKTGILELPVQFACQSKATRCESVLMTSFSPFQGGWHATLLAPPYDRAWEPPLLCPITNILLQR